METEVQTRTPYGESEAAREVVADLRPSDGFPDGLTAFMVKQAAEMMDELTECGKIISAEGPFVRDRFGKLKEHPACKRQRELRNEFGKMYRLLGLDKTPPDDQMELP